MAAWPDLRTVRSFLRLQPDPEQDAVIEQARLAALDYGIERLGKDATGAPNYPTNTSTLPDSAALACTMHAGRLYRRRDSVDGTIGFGDLGAIRVGRVDPDIEALYAQHAPLVFG
jgi:hypothetical protein